MSLTPDQLDGFRQELTRRARALREEIRGEQQKADADHATEIAGGVADKGDESVASQMSDTDRAMAGHFGEELQAVEAALRRLDDGSYGQCEDCGVDISPQRLAAYPTAPRCIACQSKAEKPRGH